MDKKNQDDAALEALFAAAADHAPEPTDAFMAKLEAEALDAMPSQPPVPTPPRPALWGTLKGLFAASGLSGAAVLGVWIGFVMPDIVSTVSPLAEETASLSAFLPGADLAEFSE